MNYGTSWPPTIPFIPIDKRLASLKTVMHRYALPTPVHNLIVLMVQKNRTTLVADTLAYIKKYYDDANQIVHCSIVSSQPLSCHDVDSLRHFLHHYTKKEVTYDLVVDKRLIAGIRIISDTFLWEFSLEKQLRNMSLSPIAARNAHGT
jgi:ATP synthase F1 delta subunit